MEKRLYINPPLLLRWLPKDEQSQVLFLDLEPDFPDDKTLRVDLNIVFRPIPVKRGRIQKKDYYIGSTGARVLFETFGGKVTKYSRATALKVDYETTYKRSRQAAVKISPKLESDSVGKLELGEVTFDKDVERSFTTKFSGSEQMLSDLDMGYAVEWEIAGPDRGAIRDYFMGNLFLFVESSWDSKKREGRIVLRPSDVIFFDSQRKRIGEGMKAILMRLVLWRKGIELNHQPVVINFKETA